MAQQTARQHGFVGFEAYVAKIGRSLQMEICFVVPPAFPIGDNRTLDAIRDEVGRLIGGEGRTAGSPSCSRATGMGAVTRRATNRSTVSPATKVTRCSASARKSISVARRSSR